MVVVLGFLFGFGCRKIPLVRISCVQLHVLWPFRNIILYAADIVKITQPVPIEATNHTDAVPEYSERFAKAETHRLFWSWCGGGSG